MLSDSNSSLKKKNLELKAQSEDLAEEIKNLKSQLANKDGDESTSAAAQAERDQRNDLPQMSKQIFSQSKLEQKQSSGG